MEKRIELERRARKANQVSFLPCNLLNVNGKNQSEKQIHAKKRAKLNNFFAVITQTVMCEYVCVQQ